MKTPFAYKLTIVTLLSVFALSTLSACGIKGDLKTPPPIWGDKSKAEQSKADSDGK